MRNHVSGSVPLCIYLYFPSSKVSSWVGEYYLCSLHRFFGIRTLSSRWIYELCTLLNVFLASQWRWMYFRYLFPVVGTMPFFPIRLLGLLHIDSRCFDATFQVETTGTFEALFAATWWELNFRRSDTLPPIIMDMENRATGRWIFLNVVFSPLPVAHQKMNVGN